MVHSIFIFYLFLRFCIYVGMMEAVPVLTQATNSPVSNAVSVVLSIVKMGMDKPVVPA